jgi:hypothetical protein
MCVCVCVCLCVFVCVCVFVIGHIMATDCVLFPRCKLGPKEVEVLKLTINFISKCTE